MTIEIQTPTRSLARYAATIRYEELPAEVIDMARRCLMDWLGIAIAGSRQPLAPVLRATIDQLGGHPQAAVIGLGARTSTVQAALMNATFAHSIDYDDVHIGSFLHPSAPVWAATLALAEWKQASAAEATAAFVAGYEVMVRIGLPTGVRMIKQYFHPTGTLGCFGAAAAAGRLLGLDEDRMAMAIGIAAGQAGALSHVRGTMSKPFFAGHAAQSGVWSALMAANGFESVTNAIEHPEGVLATFAKDCETDFAFSGLGKRYELLNNRFKAYAACAMSHPLLDGLIEVRREFAPDPLQIADIQLGVFPYATEYLNRPEVTTGLAGKFSAQYCAAVALLDGQAQEPQFTDARAGDAVLRRLAGRVRLVPVEALSIDQSEVEVRMNDGRTHRQRVEAVSGSPAKPMSWDGLAVKFESLAGLSCPAARVGELLNRLAAWPSTEVGTLLALTVPAQT